MQSSQFTPLSVVSRYLSGQFLGIFAPVLSALVLVYVIIDIFDRMRIFLKHDATVDEAARYLLFKVPLILTQITPPAVVVSVLLCLGMMSRRNEIIAFRASGVSLLQTAIPVLSVTVLISLAALVWNETVVPYSSRMFQYINNVEIRERGLRGIFRDREIWYHGANGFYSIDYVDRDRQTIHGVVIYQLSGIDDGFRLENVVAIPSAKWSDGHWILASGSIRHGVGHDSFTSETIDSGSLEIPETIGDFLEIQREPEELSFTALRDRIANLTSKGIDASHYLVELNMKLALPFANTVLAWVSIPLAGRLRRHPSIAAIIGVGVAVGFSYWVLLGLSTSLGESGAIPPLIAAWAPNAIYTLLGTVFFLYSD
jgi:lipopolysaccharide export system permease protein